MKVNRWKDVERDVRLQVRATDFGTLFFDILEGNRYVAPTVELDKRKVKSLINFLERWLKNEMEEPNAR